MQKEHKCYNLIKCTGSTQDGLKILSICPYCGAKVVAASKIWPVYSAGTNESTEEPDFFVGIFQCAKCKTKYNSKISSQALPPRTVNVKNKVERIMRIHGELMQTIKSLKEKITKLQIEKSSLMTEIETLRKTAEARVTTLETEVGQMREEAKSLRELLGNNEPAVLTVPQSPPVSS